MKRICIAAVTVLLLCTGCGTAPKSIPAAVIVEPSTEAATFVSRPTEDPEKALTDAPTEAPAEAAPAETEPEETEPPEPTTEAPTAAYTAGLLHSVEEVALTDTDGEGTNYEFNYNGAMFEAIYTPDNWKIINSYRIEAQSDMVLICTALSNEHPIHSADMQGWRTPEDMAFEWEQHNLAFAMLGNDSPWKDSARDVDINPADQGKSLYELYQDRLGAGYKEVLP